MTSGSFLSSYFTIHAKSKAGIINNNDLFTIAVPSWKVLHLLKTTLNYMDFYVQSNSMSCFKRLMKLHFRKQ